MKYRNSWKSKNKQWDKICIRLRFGAVDIFTVEIDEARFKRTTIQYQYAMMNQQQDGPEMEEESEQERKLKTN